MPRTLAIGDVHGCLTALDTLLGFVQPTPTDQLIFLGDYVDRGPDSRGVLDRIICLNLSGQLVCLRGNHEVMMIAARLGENDLRYWFHYGGREALESYVDEGSPTSLDIIPDSHWHFVEKTCVDWHETAAHIFVHATLHPDVPMTEQPHLWLHWEFLDPRYHRPHHSGKTMICGHTEQRVGEPLVLERAICIDTWAYGDGWLTCLHVENGEYWQANEFGQTRTGHV